MLSRAGIKVLKERGTDTGGGKSQIFDLVMPGGESVTARVKLCWRWGSTPKKQMVSATQLTSKIKISFEHTLTSFVHRQKKAGVSHILIVQAFADHVVHAALVPSREIKPIWEHQARAGCEDISAAMRRFVV